MGININVICAIVEFLIAFIIEFIMGASLNEQTQQTLKKVK